MQISLSQILEMPNAALLMAQVQSALEEERKERLHFYKLNCGKKKVEFINGKVISQLAQTFAENRVIGNISTYLNVFVIKNKAGFAGAQTIKISLSRNDYEPDYVFFNKKKAKFFSANQSNFPTPDLVIEVLSPSTEKIDREVKFEDYAAHGVTEYWIIDPHLEIIEQYFLQTGEYELILKSKTGMISSIVLTGFTIQVRAVFDKQINLEELRKII